MKLHRIILGWLFLILESLFFLIIGMTFLNNFANIGFLQSLVSLLFIISFVLMSFSGYGLLRDMNWAYPIAQLVAYINLINIPVGTILAVYYIWFHRTYVKVKT